MKIFRFIPIIVIPLLFSCLPKKPEIPMTEVPAGLLVQALEQRRQAFVSLKAVASVQAARKDRKRTYESVGILLKGQEKFLIEAYDPLGQPLVTLLWDGKEVLLALAGERRMIQPKSSGLERLIGTDVEPEELIAVLSGNAPAVAVSSENRAFCAQDGSCMVDMHQGNTRLLVRVAPGFSSGADIRITSYELYRSGALVFRARFDRTETISGYLLPRLVVVDNPGRNRSLTVEYGEADVNAPIDDREFVIGATEGAGL